MPSAQIRSRLVKARQRFEIALAPELQHIAAEPKAHLGTSPNESDVRERIDALLDELLPNDGGSVERRARQVFRHPLVEQLNLEPTARGH